MKTHGPRMGPFGVFAAGALLLLVSPAAPARSQTIRPVIVEYSKHRAAGRFELVNDCLIPLNVVLEPKSFAITPDGEPVYHSLDPNIHLRLSTMSIRIPAKQTRFVFYEVTADSLPAWFVIPATFSGLRSTSGLEVRIELPHTVYLVQKDRLERTDAEITHVVFRPSDRTVEAILENRSARLGRAIGAEVVAAGHRARQPSFPMPPRARRRLLIPWHSDQDPRRVLVRFHGFTLERSIDEIVRAGE